VLGLVVGFSLVTRRAPTCLTFAAAPKTDLAAAWREIPREGVANMAIRPLVRFFWRVLVLWSDPDFAGDRRFADSPLERDGFELSVPRSRKSDSFGGGEAPKGHGDDMRRFRDAEYLKRNRGLESDFLQSSVCDSSLRQPP
jgi:hypothetical protein